MTHLKAYMIKEKGFITLMTVIIVVAVAAALTISVILLGTDSLRTGQIVNNEQEATATADACAEEALGQIRTRDLIGSGSMSVGTGTCSYVITSGGGEARTIEVTASASGITRRIRITIDAMNPELHVTAWEDVADF